MEQIRDWNDRTRRGGAMVLFEWGDEENHIMLKDEGRQDVARLKGVRSTSEKSRKWQILAQYN